MELIPAIDLRDGRCVRLVQGDFDQTTVYGDDPAEVARRWEAAGATRIHVVDLDGAKAGRPTQTATVAAIVRAVGVPVQLGGGLRDQAAVDTAFELGVSDVILGTAAVRDPEWLAELVARYGKAITVGIDARNGVVATEGWLASSRHRATDLADQMARIGVARIIYTDISRDGTLSEPNYAQTAALVQPGGPAIIASGGIARVEHLQKLAEYGIAGAIVGTALYTGHIDLAGALATLAGR
ncbi:MAG TPA: 1-(5-phosphoribosyl)-5-[(5-phosphoribosylamino)methylideneamino]imidazole-4-carboxamide isomerase [Herpetosiphonaceae bacterium]|nr:1-(5-phosphoribosyl)-5-[(5-phosphoribosylamino)methylideneamino]imidazole-4-carboxamide isomerase [Herpetosiphonaceae bacterium]